MQWAMIVSMGATRLSMRGLLVRIFMCDERFHICELMVVLPVDASREASYIDASDG